MANASGPSIASDWSSREHNGWKPVLVDRIGNITEPDDRVAANSKQYCRKNDAAFPGMRAAMLDPSPFQIERDTTNTATRLLIHNPNSGAALRRALEYRICSGRPRLDDVLAIADLRHCPTMQTYLSRFTPVTMFVETTGKMLLASSFHCCSVRMF